MATPLHVLIVEDSEDDAALIVRELERGGYQVTHTRVDNAAALHEALVGGKWDIVIADYVVPGFDGLAALKQVRAHDPELPVIVVSGTVGEELAVGAMKSGAQDYIMKESLTRLALAVEREVREAEDRRQRRRAEENLRQEHERVQVQLHFAHTLNRMAEAVIASDDSPNVLRALARIMGEALRVDGVLICNVDAAQQQLARLSIWGTDVGPLEAAVLREPLDLLRQSRTWLESHADARHPAFREGRPAGRLHDDSQIRSLLAYPFLFRGSAFCLLVFLNTGERRVWREDEVKFLDAVAKQVELALQKIHILTERKQVEEALRESQIRLRKVTEFWDFGGAPDRPSGR
jgi:CheY-like chemotaxis protein